MARPSKEVVAEGTELLRRVLAAVDDGELDADGRKGAGMYRRIEGSIVGAELAAGLTRIAPADPIERAALQ